MKVRMMAGMGLLLMLLLETVLPATGLTEMEVQKQYCCFLSEKELDDMRGLHEVCPRNCAYALNNDEQEKCVACPAGTCRVSSIEPGATNGCVCVDDFLDYTRIYFDFHGACVSYYGASWPNSVGVINKSLRSCVSTPAPSPPIPTAFPTCSRKDCPNGTFDTETCACTCYPGFQGDSCDQCQPNYYGTDCQTYCNDAETCGGSGRCSSDGQRCECAAGKYGIDCSCGAKNCTAAAAGTTSTECSGRGSCSDSQCSCDSGYVGCSCELQCDVQTDCSGHGQCQSDGSCKCSPGYVGSDCATLDLATYCSTGSTTVSGRPCLPGIITALGFGFDAITGAPTTSRIVSLLFSQGKVFTHGAVDYEIPDNVECSAITTSESGFSTLTYSSAYAYRQSLAVDAGLSAEILRTGNEGYLSASGSYTYVNERAFSQDRTLFASKLTHGLYECFLVGEVTATSVPTAITLRGDSLVEKFGTHYVKKVIYGGRLSVFTFVESCVFASETTRSVSAQIEASVYSLAGSAGGSVGSMVTNSNQCSAFQSNSIFSKTVEGGSRELLILPNASSLEDFRDWIDSIITSTAPITYELESIDSIVPAINADVVQSYVDKYQVILDDEVPTNGTVACPTVCTSNGTAQRRGGWVVAGLSFLVLVQLAYWQN